MQIAQAMAKPKSVILCDESLNRYGFRIDLKGLNLDAFNANPVMLREHEYDCIIGRWLNLRIEDGKLLGDPEFDESTEEGQKAKSQFENGFLRAASLGFMIIAESADAEMLVPGQSRPTVTEAEALEASFVAVPAGRNCLALYNKAGQRLALDDATLSQLNLHTIIPSTQTDSMKTVQLSAAALNFLSLTETASQADFEAKVKELSAKAAQYDTLKAEIETSRKLSAKAMVDKAIEAKKLTEADRAAFEKLAYDNPEAAQSAIDRIPGVTLPNQQIKQTGNGEGSERKLAADRAAWTFEDWNKNDYAGLEAMRAENLSAYNTLFEDYKKRLNGK